MLNAAQFDFGENWDEFSEKALSPDAVRRAKAEFQELIAPINLAGIAFLDIGFGQGLTLLTAASLGANTVGCDINPRCAAVLSKNIKYFPTLSERPPVVVGSILDNQTVELLRGATRTGNYGIVHAWGVLHHTGDMEQAIKNAASLVAPHGVLVLAIYNRHWSSKPWLLIKWAYVHSPRWFQRTLIGVFYPIIYAAKWLVTLKDPTRQDRGMNFYYNVVDWVGGYPYEYATVDQVISLLRKQHFAIVKVKRAVVPTGCNEFLFRREE